jgi:hypothetical protein
MAHEDQAYTSSLGFAAFIITITAIAAAAVLLQIYIQ